MSQVFAKPYDCLSCGQQIRLSKIDNPTANSRKKWLKYEMDGKTEHSCNNNNNNNNNNKPEEQEQLQQHQHQYQQEDLAEELTHLREENKELRALVGLTRADVRSLVAQVQLLRQELTNPEKKEKGGGNGGKK